jgi:hypothetical protein
MNYPNFFMIILANVVLIRDRETVIVTSRLFSNVKKNVLKRGGKPT